MRWPNNKFVVVSFVCNKSLKIFVGERIKNYLLFTRCAILQINCSLSSVFIIRREKDSGPLRSSKGPTMFSQNSPEGSKFWPLVFFKQKRKGEILSLDRRDGHRRDWFVLDCKVAAPRRSNLVDDQQSRLRRAARWTYEDGALMSLERKYFVL